MNNKGKGNYYWYYRLKNTFFQDGTIRILKHKRDGHKLVCILLELYCEALNNAGYIFLKNSPYEDGGLEDLAVRIDEEAKDIAYATKIFQALELVEVSPVDETSSGLYFKELPNMYGKSSLRADQQRIRDREGKGLPIPLSSERPNTKVYGLYENVYLTDDEYAMLAEKYKNRNQLIERVSLSKKRTGKEYADDCAAVLTFAITDGIEKSVKQNHRYELLPAEKQRKELEKIYEEHPRLKELNQAFTDAISNKIIYKHNNPEFASKEKERAEAIKKEIDEFKENHGIVFPEA